MYMAQKAKKKSKLRHAEYYDMQKTFDSLYANSKSGEVFGHLMDIISAPSNIKLAFRNIKGNDGSHTAGTDGRTIESLAVMPEDNFVKLIQKQFRRYEPKAVRRVEIPKPNGKMRPLGIPCIIDRIVQQCILQVMEPICEAKFYEHSYGFRPCRSAENAISYAYGLAQRNKLHYVVDVDVKGFFDNVDHRKLLKQIWTLGIRDTKLIQIIKAMLKASIEMPDGETVLPSKGTPQGGILSPLLANIVLNELDWWIASQWEEMVGHMKHPCKVTYYPNGAEKKCNSYTALKKSSLKEMRIVRYTGTDANREDFQRLLADVMSGKINCVIVKDLSRFARNYSDAGSLIDNLFVQMGVRFISLAENVDSYKNPDSVSNIIVPITNVMNDNYCYQTSKKIRQVFDYKRRNGQYIGAFAPYGYVKHPKDKHRLIVDPDAAENVKLIFTMLIQGSSKRAIALYLNEHGVPSPSAYKVQKGLPVSTRGYDDPMWGARMIHSILTNPTYTGDLAQGRSRVKSYKVHQIEAVPREEWVEVAGTHEAIIDYETFDKVQALLQRDTRTSPKGREVHLFSGFLKCADCGRAITRCVSKNNNVYYSCSTYKNRSRTACTMHSIKHERLEAAVLFAVQHQVHLAVSYSEIVTQINSAPIKKSQSYRLDDLIAAKERELTKITRYKQSLYQDWKDGEITQQEYRDMKADYERQTSDISAVLTRLNAERAELANGVDNEHPALVAFMKYQNIEALNREILVELVDYIKVYENGNISVKFKFADELRKIAEYIEINTTEDTAVAG